MLATNDRVYPPSYMRSNKLRAYRHVLLTAFLPLALCVVAAVPTLAQVSGQNVNMVSGTNWTNGDPFLQRQNEPSIAVSSRNSSHLLAGANDYRTVDLPGLLVIDERGDAWLGLFKSFDGGRTWQSTLLPGFPLDGSLQGQASPIHGYGPLGARGPWPLVRRDASPSSRPQPQLQISKNLRHARVSLFLVNFQATHGYCV
jgi:hypothetical protein